jgi:hypothetical protein
MAVTTGSATNASNGLTATVFYGPQTAGCGTSYQRIATTGSVTVATTSNTVTGIILSINGSSQSTTSIPALTVTDLATSNTYALSLAPKYTADGGAVVPAQYAGQVFYQAHNSLATSPASGPTHPLGFSVATSNSTDDATIFYRAY